MQLLLDTILDDPLSRLAEAGGVLAAITGVDGSAYRPVGAAMAFCHDGRRTGYVSSGCIEEALACEASEVAKEGRVRTIRYGRGSPWIDIRLPCGAGLDITLWPGAGGWAVIGSAEALARRQAHSIHLPKTGIFDAILSEIAPAAWHDETFILPRIPPLRLAVFGTGIETVAFSRLAQAAGYSVETSSSDKAVLSALPDARPYTSPSTLPSVEADPQTAVVLFFHDHDSELPILRWALEGQAFWIGAQGSARARDLRWEALASAGVGRASIERLETRIGLIPSARDPQTLAISVLADVTAAYKVRWFDPYFGARKAAEFT